VPAWLSDEPAWLSDEPTWLSDEPTWLSDEPTWLSDEPAWLSDELYLSKFEVRLVFFIDIQDTFRLSWRRKSNLRVDE
jgi:hypothetical protein